MMYDIQNSQLEAGLQSGIRDLRVGAPIGARSQRSASGWYNDRRQATDGQGHFTDMNPRQLARVIGDYQAPYTNPIVLDAGAEITIDTSKKTDLIGWVWCTNRAGSSGGVPEIYIERHGDKGRMRCSYDGIEMTIYVGEILTLHQAASGFYWATNQAGQSGWVPSMHIQIETT